MDKFRGHGNLSALPVTARQTKTKTKMKHSILLTGPNGSASYLSHRGTAAFAPATARRYLAQWLAANPGGIARIEDQFGDRVKSCATAPFPVTLIGDADHAAKQAETVRALTTRPAWKLSDCTFTA